MNFLQFNVQRLLGVPFEDMGMYFKGGSKKQTSSTTSKPHQQGQYNDLLEGADSWREGGGFDKEYGGSSDFDPVADFTPEQLEAIKGMGSGGRDLQELLGGAGMQGLADSLGTYDPSKTGLNASLDNMYERSNFDFDTNQAGQVRQGATGAGQFGSSRHGIAEGLARDRLSQNQTATASQMAMQDQQSWNTQRQNTLNNLSGIAKGLNAGNTQLYDSGALQQGQTQAEIGGDLQKWAYENNVELNDLLAYKNLITGDMGGKNVTTGTGGASGGGWGSALGSMGGAALGGYFGGSGGAGVGAGVGGNVGGLLG